VGHVTRTGGIPTTNSDRRAFIRHSVRLEGICSITGAEGHKVEIRDFCPEGMLLSYDVPGVTTQSEKITPAHGDIVEIRCAVPKPDGEPPLLFHGRIVRIEEGSVGLAFIDPDPNALAILNDYANTDQADANVSKSPEPPQSLTGKNQTAQALFLGCKQLAKDHFGAMLADFQEQATERWLTLADTAQSIPEKNAYHDALNIFNKRGDEFKHAYVARMTGYLDNFSLQVAVKSAGSLPDIFEKDLALIEEKAFEEWLSYVDMARKVELECQEPLYDFGLRLEALSNLPIDKENNPFWPEAYCKAFRLTLKEFSIGGKVLKVAYTVFKEVLESHVDGLYADLNQYLVKHGVLPDLRHKYKVKNSRSKTPIQHRAPVISDGGAAAAHGLYAKGEIDSDGGLSVGAPTPTSEDWYRIAQGLDDLRKQVSRQATQDSNSWQGKNQSAFLPGDAGPPGAAPQYYTSEELLFALSRLNFPGHTQSVGGNVKQEVKSQLLSELFDGVDETARKQLPRREEKILDVTGNLFDSLLTDKLVSDNVRPWLQQLSIPMFKWAMHDDSVLSDKSHLTRQLINNIAQLEFYGEEESDKSLEVARERVRNRINNLIAEIAQADFVTPELFDRASKKLSFYVEVQSKAYEGNLEGVVAACEADQRAIDAGGAAKYTAVSAALMSGEQGLQGSPEIDDEELREWRKHVRRLRVGHSLSLNVESVPRHLKLAWIAKNFDRYVFVNAKGLKELTLGADQLAQQLRSGMAVFLDDSGEPLLDRAQYSMLQEMHQNLLHESTHDHLTGLINRREFEKLLTEALASARQSARHHVICYIDLDQFSVVNNTFGYDGGDRLLVELTALFQKALGDRGTLARIGGDEFGMLLEDCSIEEALDITARQKDAIQDYRFICDNKSLSISFSAGLAVVKPDSASVIMLFQEAESSCRIARGKGINYAQVYSSDDNGLSRQGEAIKWVTKIDEALDNNSLDLRFQPIVHIAGDRLFTHHAEVLLGILDEQGKSISPAEFVLAAEQFRRIAAVDRWVIERTFRWMVEHGDKLDEIGGLAINLSGASLNEEGFVDYIIEQANEKKVPMQKVNFEVTETAGIANLSNATDFILSLKETGCTFSLDDFGSGLSSYAYLKNLPVDFLKIDGAFVRKMDENPYDYAVVKSITEIGHFMGKKIIAEFVQNEKILSMLREIGVDYAQGYVLAKPRNLLTWE
jgi:diguanylate cyclase (GGDEF)-like protein